MKFESVRMFIQKNINDNLIHFKLRFMIKFLKSSHETILLPFFIHSVPKYCSHLLGTEHVKYMNTYAIMTNNNTELTTMVMMMMMWI